MPANIYCQFATLYIQTALHLHKKNTNYIIIKADGAPRFSITCLTLLLANYAHIYSD